VCAAYFTSSENPHYTELMDAVETLSNDKDRDVQYIICKHLHEYSHWLLVTSLWPLSYPPYYIHRDPWAI